jgi:hypothetical protein
MAFGVAQTNMDDQEFGILNTLSGSAKAGQQAMDFANQLYPQVAEADPWEAAFQFFSEMGRAASQPGATVLSSAVGSMQVPMDYLNAKKKEKLETDRARMQTAVQIAPSLKPKAVSVDYNDVMVDGVAQVMTDAEIREAKKAGKTVSPYEKTSDSTSTFKERKFFKTGFDPVVVKNEADAASFEADPNWTSLPPDGWVDSKGGTDEDTAEVQSTKILDGGVIVYAFKDGTSKVVNSIGEEVKGQARADAIRDAEELGIRIQTERAGGRAAATFAVKASGEAFDNILSSRTNIANLREAKRLILEEGANTGFIVDNFPSWKDSTIALDNVKNRLGLDVVGSVTFGALSASELDLALNTALPTNKTEEGLVKWIEDKIVAQEKLQDYLYEQATFLADGDKTVGDWLRKQKADQEESDRTAAARRQAGTDFDFSTMPKNKILEIDIDTLDSDQFEAWEKRMDELGL